ncbi:Carbohydrate-selective porin OprB [Desulfurobacterium pacificum]|uniref:Carbohydrate-selective porin OprB n=1 Tax=Desulfurobacterium pacificum TaxID=240166 RepID=A0ABY1NK68_9BACT|nr:carbohydrate porin [Desulfurobacterium pacificum]SMP11829.1 Carbohydrate-selective porin OprB [Desulfurobacterium pacificum]
MRGKVLLLTSLLLMSSLPTLGAELKVPVEFHGDATLYYQGAKVGDINNVNIPDPSGTGYTADLELSFNPDKNGEFYTRVHAGDGTGADKIFDYAEDALFANLNTLADDNPEGKTFEILELYYSHSFLNGKLQLTVGKTEPFAFIDDNEYANDEVSQFVGKPFVNNPILDPEDFFAPLIAAQVTLSENLSFTALVQSNQQTTIYWNSDDKQWEVREKSEYDNVFDKPFLAAQLNYSTENGNYRFYIWDNTADHIKLGETTDNPNAKPDTEQGWGAGISIDQKITDKIGIFGRASYANRNVYAFNKFVSAGISINSPFNRGNTLSAGVAAIIPSSKFENDDTEWHFETYYDIKVSENFHIMPDIQYVVNPNGSSNNDSIFAGMVKMVFTF